VVGVETQVSDPEQTTADVTELTRRIEEADGLDEAVDVLARNTPDWVTSGRSREILSGEWLGHSLHPLLTDLPLGFWTSATVLDLLGGRRHAKAARKLVGLGVLSALPTAAAGLSDWSRLDDKADRRVGVVHAQLNGAALFLYLLSYLARCRGRRGRGVFYSLLGGVAATASGYLGGHLTLSRAVTRDDRLLDESPSLS
jgi:uncharacterized membrane protein